MLNDCSQVVDGCSQGIQDLNEAPFLFYATVEKVVFVFLGIIWKKKRNKILSQYPVCSFTVYKLCLWKPKCIGYYTMLSQAHTIISGAVLPLVPHRWQHMKKSISNLQKSNLIE